jgi:uncharacterized protein YjdB
MSAQQLGKNQKFPTVVALFTEADGTPVTAFPGAPVWASSNPAAATIIPTVDGFGAEIDGAAAGLTTITVTATNPDGTTDVLSADLLVVEGDAVGGGITFGSAVPK